MPPFSWVCLAGRPSTSAFTGRRACGSATCPFHRRTGPPRLAGLFQDHPGPGGRGLRLPGRSPPRVHHVPRGFFGVDGQPVMRGVRIAALVSLVAVLIAGRAAGEETVFRSDDRQVVLLELFTSQGCSSCPPADGWLSGLRTDDGLWTRFVPVAFHVDYWDRLGWTDPFASKEATERQYTYRRAGHLESVYTPGMVAAGREWRGWRRGANVPKASARSGVLAVRLRQTVCMRRFSGEGRGLHLHYAVLGFGLRNQGAAGRKRRAYPAKRFRGSSSRSGPRRGRRMGGPLAAPRTSRSRTVCVGCLDQPTRRPDTDPGDRRMAG